MFSLPLFLAASLFLPSQVVPFAHASPATGLVCITSSSSATSCPTSAPSLGPFTAGQTFTVGVFIQGSDAMGGFDIYVQTDNTFVNPTGAALGSLIANPSLTSICINGAATIGSCTANSANGPGVVEVTTIESSGSNECGSISPCSGMAFTITYQVVGTTNNPIPLSYPTHPACSQSSVSNPPNVCVQVADAFGTTLSENIQGASVSAPVVSQTGLVCIVYPATATSCSSSRAQIGPVTVGSSFTVGVWVSNSQPLGGFDIYVFVDPTYLRPTDAALGNLITNPSSTVICVNGQSKEGACTVINGQGIVECSTIEDTGNNDPGTGLACTITFLVVAKIPSTPIEFLVPRPGFENFCLPSSVGTTDICVTLNKNTGEFLPENAQGADVIQNVFPDQTTTSLSCAPNPVVVGNPTACIATVTDTNMTAPSPPTGTVEFFTGQSGNFNPNLCTLQTVPGTSNKATCNTIYTPSHVDTGTHSIDATYSGDAAHRGSSAPSFPLTVLKATPSVSTAVIVDSTGGSPNANGEPVGTSFHDNAVLLGGYPVTGVSGTVTYTLYPNSKCTAGTGTIVSVRTVLASNNVAGSDSVTPAAGSYSFNALYSGDPDTNAVTSACEQFTVLPGPTFAAGKLHWTHHLSLAKSSNTQTWTAIVANSFTTSVNVVVRITGSSTTNPTMNFDVICGVICVNTNGDVSTAAASAGPVPVAAGANSFSFSFSQSISPTFANQKIAFTATLYWTLGTTYTPSSIKSGAFAVVP